ITAGSSSIASEVTSIETCVARILDLGTLKVLGPHNKSDARTHRTPKALRAKYEERGFHFAEALECVRVLASLWERRRPRFSQAACRRGISRDPKSWPPKSSGYPPY